MSITSGFWNSLNEDRPYDATEMAKIFDGIINDGIYGTIYDKFKVTSLAGTGGANSMSCTIGTGRAWFNHIWVLNDAPLVMTCDPAEVLLNRIDCFAIEIDGNDSVREGKVVYIKGTPAANAVRPTLVSGPLKFQHPLAFIAVNKGVSTITQANITSMIGTPLCPMVTGPLDMISSDQILEQWARDYYEWRSSIDASWSDQMETFETFFTNKMAAFDTTWNDYMQNFTDESQEWYAQKKTEFDTWFNDLHIILDGDVAANLANRILALETSMGELPDALQHIMNEMEMQVGDANKRIDLLEKKAHIFTPVGNLESGELQWLTGQLLAAKRKVFRGYPLGTTITAAQYATIKSGKFDELYIGDYWTIGGVNWRIADFNYYEYPHMATKANSLVLVPDSQITALPTPTFIWNSNIPAEDSYNGSNAASFYDSIVGGVIQNQFKVNGANAYIAFQDYVPGLMSYEGSNDMFNRYSQALKLMVCCPLSKYMVFGDSIFSMNKTWNTGIERPKRKLALFELAPEFITFKNSVGAAINYALLEPVTRSNMNVVVRMDRVDKLSMSTATYPRPFIMIG